MLYCNTHVHSPYSSGTGLSVDEMVQQARRNEIAVLGINDDISIDGFREFDSSCRSHCIYPLFNITLPVRCAFEHHSVPEVHPDGGHSCRLIGKALRFPPLFSSDSRNLLASLWKASQDRVWKRIDTLNTIFEQRQLPLLLDYSAIRSRYAKSAVYDQHIILALYDLLTTDGQQVDKMTEQLTAVFNIEKPDGTPEHRNSQLTLLYRQFAENTLFSSVNHSTEGTIPLAQAKQIILQAGGIPCFHCSFNKHDEWMKESKGPDLLVRQLSAKGIHVVEFIPGETTIELLDTFMRHLYRNRFCITMGSGTTDWPATRLHPVCKDGNAPDDDLLAMSYEGACVLAAHQEMLRQKRSGFVDESGKRLVGPDRMKAFVALGDEVIRAVLNK